ncbi:MAG: hypothetical protein V9G19_27180 [Tetrasphaera sp.]
MTQTAVKLTRDGAKPTLRSAPGPRALAHTRARVRRGRGGRPSLRIVPGRVATNQAWFAVGMLVTLVAGLLLTLLINTRLAEGTYTRNRLAVESSYLADRQEVLTDELDAVRAPAALARQALALGMVPAASPAFISLEQARVLGSAEAATSSDFSVVTDPSTPPDAAAGQSADGSAPSSGSPATTSDSAAPDVGSPQPPAGAATPGASTDTGQATSTPGLTPTTETTPTETTPGEAVPPGVPGGEPTEE